MLGFFGGLHSFVSPDRVPSAVLGPTHAKASLIKPFKHKAKQQTRILRRLGLEVKPVVVVVEA